jgi:hypothetical protein
MCSAERNLTVVLFDPCKVTSVSLKDMIPKMLILFWEKNYGADFGHWGYCSKAHFA